MCLISFAVGVADSYIKISFCLMQLASSDGSSLKPFFLKTAECFEKAKKFEGKAASDEDLKLSDTLRYYMRDSTAAKVSSDDKSSASRKIVVF